MDENSGWWGERLVENSMDDYGWLKIVVDYGWLVDIKLNITMNDNNIIMVTSKLAININQYVGKEFKYGRLAVVMKV